MPVPSTSMRMPLIKSFTNTKTRTSLSNMAIPFEFCEVNDCDGDVVLRADGIGVLRDALRPEVWLVEAAADVTHSFLVTQDVP